jgi:nucleoside-diphosphate-sugar epimerase
LLDALLGELAGGATATASGGACELTAAVERMRTPTHVADVAAGLLLALSSPKALGEDFNLGGAEELALGEIAQIAWQACDGRPDALSLLAPSSPQPGPQRSAPSSRKAQRLLGWSSAVETHDGIAASARVALADVALGALA